MIRGISISEGVVVAKAFVREEVRIQIKMEEILDPEQEIQRLLIAVNEYIEQLEYKYNKTLNVLGEEEANIYKNHISILKDSVVVSGVKKQIRDRRINAEFILEEVKNKYEAIYGKMADDFLKKKAEYIRNITDGIIRILSLEKQEAPREFSDDVILLAKGMSEVETMEFHLNHVVGIILENGNKTGYEARLTQNWKIPAVIGVKRISELVKNGDLLILDGNKGEVIINPEPELVAFYTQKSKKERELTDIYKEYSHIDAVTKDFHRLEIGSLVGSLEGLRTAIEKGGEYVGVFRTEFVFIGRNEMPSEEEQFVIYREALLANEGRRLCIRTFDCTEYNDLPYIHMINQHQSSYGYFSTRVALNHREILLTQLCAILRASAYGEVSFVVPMISTVDELLDVRLLLEDAKLSLEDREIDYQNIRFGIVLETPAAAVITNFFAMEVDFLYVDLDDMLRYMTGVDPMNDMVFELYDEYHPGFIRILRSIIRSAHREGTSVAFYGELCMSEALVPVLVAMGVDQLIVNSDEIGRLRWEVNSMYKMKWDQILEELLSMGSGREIKSFLERNFWSEIANKNEDKDLS
ncbi:MAG: phosphoenolpyruvate--protein phosphotransferase [Vallitaleaceae bacterium]|nr:phosphoenolpyruvate--protein phosphotransferase [Vallitaleaceae bacterium]